MLADKDARDFHQCDDGAERTPVPRRGKAAVGNSGRITYNMLNLYISERVKDLTKGQQHPTMISPATVPDFPVAVIR